MGSREGNYLSSEGREGMVVVWWADGFVRMGEMEVVVGDRGRDERGMGGLRVMTP